MRIGNSITMMGELVGKFKPNKPMHRTAHFVRSR